MPAAVLSYPKRALADSTNLHRNTNLPALSQNCAKRRKLEPGSSPAQKLDLSQNAPKLGSSQPAKSQFEEDVLEKLTQDISGLKQRNSEKDQQWDRPKLDDFDPDRDSLCFQQIEAEEGTLHGGRTTVKLFGVTEVNDPVTLACIVLTGGQAGHSVLLHVTGFLHYIYIAAPVSFTKADCAGFKTYLETQLAQHQPTIHSVEMVLRENLFGFQGNQKSPYLKIIVTDPKHINKLRVAIERGDANYKSMWKGVDGGVLTFDSIQYVLRFMIDTGVCTSSSTHQSPD